MSSAQDLATQDPEATGRPSFTWTLITLLTPLVLMLIKAAADLLLPKGNALRSFLDFVGDPVVALLAGVLLAMITFGTKVGFSATVLSKKISDSLLPIVGVVFIVGAGGGFKQELVDGGASTAIAKLATDAGLSALLLGWLVAVLIRLATGSATVATVTAAGIIAPLAVGLSQPNLALVVLAIGAGSLFFSHVNDAGFLAGQGVFRPQCRSDDQDLVGDGNHHFGDRPGDDGVVVRLRLTAAHGSVPPR